jgi:CHAD domain-containing protein
MSAPGPLEFMIPLHDDPAPLIAQLAAEFDLAEREPESFARTYYDSFDWRLHRAGLEFAIDTLADRLEACFERAWEGRSEPFAVAAAPRFAPELPEGKWRSRVVEVLEMRALLPRIELTVERRVFAREDGEGTPMVVLALENFKLRDGEAWRPLPARVRLHSAKGCRKTLRQVRERLGGEFGWEPAAESLLSAALGLLGQVPEDPSALLRTPLDPELRADAAMKQVLGNLLEVMRINEAGAKAEIDTEFLHDFRVAVRRTRSALGQVKKVFPERVVQRYGKAFAGLGRITGEPRDMDVYLLDFEGLAGSLAEPLRPGLEPLREFLRRRAAKAHARLNRHLESVAYRRLVQSWGEFLAAPPPARPRAAKALAPIAAVADKRIWKLYRRVLREGGAITPESPAEQVHGLRKTAKKLRYLMEFFRSLYPADRIGPLVKSLKSLQDLLGEYQDIHVQIAELRQFASELREGDAPTETLLALGGLLERLYARERLLREGFGERFGSFAEEAQQRRFRHLFKPAGDARDKADSGNG